MDKGEGQAYAGLTFQYGEVIFLTAAPCSTTHFVFIAEKNHTHINQRSYSDQGKLCVHVRMGI